MFGCAVGWQYWRWRAWRQEQCHGCRCVRLQSMPTCFLFLSSVSEPWRLDWHWCAAALCAWLSNGRKLNSRQRICRTPAFIAHPGSILSKDYLSHFVCQLPAAADRAICAPTTSKAQGVQPACGLQAWGVPCCPLDGLMVAVDTVLWCRFLQQSFLMGFYT